MASEWTTEDVRWFDLLRKIGLGLGLHEPLRTEMIEEGYGHLRDDLVAHDAEVRAKALEDAADAYEALPEGERTYFPGIHAGWLRARAERGEA